MNEEIEENPFYKKNEENKEKLDRKSLEKLTNNDLAEMVSDKYLSKHKVTTLKSYSKKRLIDLLLGIEVETDKTTARAPQTQSDSEAIVDDILSTLEQAKKIRSNENAKNNTLTSKIFKANAEKIIDKALADDKFSSSSFNKLATYVSLGALMVDTFIGFENIPKLIQSLKEKLKKKEEKSTKNTHRVQTVNNTNSRPF